MAEDHPWHALPPEIARVLRPELPGLTEEVIRAVGAVPGYRRPLEGEFGVGIRTGVQAGLGHFLDEIEAGGPVQRRDVYRRLGAGEMRSGRSLDSLLAAYRIGARVAWRRFAAAGEAAGFDPPILYRLAESIFAYIDVLSSESVEGYAAEQSHAAGEVELARRLLVRLLVHEPVPDPAIVRSAAADARWVPPRALAVLACTGAASRLRVAPEILIGDGEDGIGCVLVPDPEAPGRRESLRRAIGAPPALRAAVGPTVGWEAAPLSWSRARAALALARQDGELVLASERAGELLLRADRGLAAELAASRLAVFEGLTPVARARMRATLEAWLAEQGRLGAVSARLGVHPQTARYRIGRLRDLLGSALDDPEERFWLALALRAEESLELSP
jgi:hypothetical protein